MLDLTRREFLQATLSLGGGLVLGVSLPSNSAARSSVPTSQLNAWLKIARDNTITVIVDRSEMGQGVYTALPTLIAEELYVDLDSIQITAAPVGDVYNNPGNGGQVTGTSNSVQDAWEKLRLAGAQARTMLINAAARQWHVDPSDCHAVDGTIVNGHGRILTYGALADAAAKEPVPKDVVLKPRTDFKLIGKPRVRIDTPGKVDGSAEFGLDVKLPGMLYATLSQCPVLGGKLKSIDSAVAEKMPGVRKVLVTHDGVIIVAEHFWQALQARDALHIVWDPGPNAQLDNDVIGALLRKAADGGDGLIARGDGNANAAIKDAARSLHARYELPLLAHATMEPMNCTADMRPDGCDIFVGTQVQQVAQMTAATAAGLQPSQVRVFTTLLGGGFGRRLDIDFIPAAVHASRSVASPVKVIWTREDDMTHDTYRPPALEDISGAFDTAGKLIAIKLHVTSPSITERMFPPVKGVDDSVVEYAINLPYDVPNYLLCYTRQEIGIDVGYMRSVSHAPNCFAIESFMDELAAAAGEDPYVFRMELLNGKPRHQRVLKMTAERAGWGHAPVGRHQGIAFMVGYTTHIAQVIELSIEAGQIKIHKITCVVDCGQMVNPKIVESQIESGIIFGLTAALWGEVTISQGKVQQTNFNNYRLLRGNELPLLDVLLLDSDEMPGGIGEAAVALVAPAICNAYFSATTRRLRSLPIAPHYAAM